MNKIFTTPCDNKLRIDYTRYPLYETRTEKLGGKPARMKQCGSVCAEKRPENTCMLRIMTKNGTRNNLNSDKNVRVIGGSVILMN